MTWDELLKLGAAALGVLVTAALGYGARALEAHQASKRALRADLRKVGTEKAELLMEELDGISASFSSQRQNSRAIRLYAVDDDVHRRAARLARLMPDAELRSVLVAGVEGLWLAWLVIDSEERRVTDLQLRSLVAMQEALSCYLTGERIPPYVHERAWQLAQVTDPVEARAALRKWGPKQRGLAQLTTWPRRLVEKDVSSL